MDLKIFIKDYIFLVAPIVAFALAQGIKVLLQSLSQKITWRNFFAYSNMPSGHTAVVVALTVILALEEGLASPIFAASFVFSAIVIVDAIGLRNYLGKHGETINVLVEDLDEDEFLDRSYPELLEKIGHTPFQVIIGALIGIIVSCLFYCLF